MGGVIGGRAGSIFLAKIWVFQRCVAGALLLFSPAFVVLEGLTAPLSNTYLGLDWELCYWQRWRGIDGDGSGGSGPLRHHVRLVIYN